MFTARPARLLTLASQTRSPAFCTPGNGRAKIAFASVNSAVFAPTPTASVSAAMTVNAGVRASCRKA
jgi:hypothetical protein